MHILRLNFAEIVQDRPKRNDRH